MPRSDDRQVTRRIERGELTRAEAEVAAGRSGANVDEKGDTMEIKVIEQAKKRAYPRFWIDDATGQVYLLVKLGLMYKAAGLAGTSPQYEWGHWDNAGQATKGLRPLGDFTMEVTE